MNWEAIGGLGQWLGSIAVLISIAYLASQVRQARDAVARSTRQMRADINIRLSLAVASSEPIANAQMKMNDALQSTLPAFIDAAVNRTGVTREEAIRVYWMQQAWWAARASIIPYLDELTPGERAEFDSNARLALGTVAVGRLWYDSMKAGLNPDAVRYVDDLLARSDP